MTKLEIEFIRADNSTSVLIDGKFAKLKKNKNGNKYCTVETEKESVEVAMYKTHHYTGKFWFWRNLLYFFISILGIFDTRHDKRMLVAQSTFKVDTTHDAKISVGREDFVDGGKFAKFEGDTAIEEISNIQYCDKLAQKRHKTMKKAKIALAVGLIAIAIVLICLL